MLIPVCRVKIADENKERQKDLDQLELDTIRAGEHAGMAVKSLYYEAVDLQT